MASKSSSDASQTSRISLHASLASMRLVPSSTPSTTSKASLPPKPNPQNNQHYKTLTRDWPGAEPFLSQVPTPSFSSTTGMTPMERWENEPLKESFWTAIADFELSCPMTRDTSGPGQSQGKSSDATQRSWSWSLVGDDDFSLEGLSQGIAQKSDATGQESWSLMGEVEWECF